MTEEQKEALLMLAKAYDLLSTVLNGSEIEGEENLGETLADLGVLPFADLDVAAAEIHDLLEGLNKPATV